MATDKDIEAEIIAKGKTAPRVTVEQVNDIVDHEYYFTAADGVSNTSVGPNPPSASSLELMTFAVLVLKNGFMVTGESACASPENFDAEIGKKIARQNAVNKIWGLLGYELRTKLQEG